MDDLISRALKEHFRQNPDCDCSICKLIREGREFAGQQPGKRGSELTYDYRRNKAVSLLGHYFRTVWEKAGLKWDGDNEAEIEELVDVLLAGE